MKQPFSKEFARWSVKLKFISISFWAATPDFRSLGGGGGQLHKKKKKKENPSSLLVILSMEKNYHGD